MTQANVQLLFDVLCGLKSLSCATKIFPDSLVLSDYQHSHDVGKWEKCTHWCDWWRRPNHLRMLCACYSEVGPDQFARLPNSTNAVESHNRFGKATHPLPLKAAMMSTYKEDMGQSIRSDCQRERSINYL